MRCFLRHDMEKQDDSDIEGLLRSVCPDTTPRPGFQEELLGRLIGGEGTGAQANAGLRIASRRSRSIHRMVAGLAAMLVVAVAAWWLLGGQVGQASAGFSEVLTRIRNARTVAFDLEDISYDGLKVRTHIDMSYPGRIRITYADGRITIINQAGGKRLNINPSKRRATLIPIDPHTAFAGPMDELRQVVASQGKLVGTEKLKGLRTDVYQVALDGSALRVWVDPGSDFPVRVESMTKQADGREELTVLENFSWNAQLPEAVFSLTPPAGYTLVDQEAVACEQSLIDLLNICAKDADGCFPDSLDDMAFLSIVQKKYPDEFKTSVGSTSDMPIAATVIGQAREDYKAGLLGLVFIRQVAGKGQFHYVGKGVKFGDSAGIVCWWQLNGSATLKVVYGDLAVRDMPAGELSPEALSNRVNSEP
jgi:hypothetical protein